MGKLLSEIYAPVRNLDVPPFASRRFNARMDAPGPGVLAPAAVPVDIPWAGHAFDKVPNGLSGQLSLFYTERCLSWAFRR